MRNTKSNRLVRLLRFGLTAVVVLLSMIPPAARADILTSPELATTVMTEALLGIGNFLAAQSGTAAENPIQFATTVDPLGQSFFYIATGLYNGQQLSISGTGSITPADVWILNSQTQSGISQWSVTGTATLTATGTGAALTAQSDVSNEYILNTDQSMAGVSGSGTWMDVGDVTCCAPTKPKPSTDKLHCCHQDPDPSTDVTSIDLSSATTGIWDVTDIVDSGVFAGLSIIIDADTPLMGGDGTAVMSTSTVDEPSELVVYTFIFGLMIATACMRERDRTGSGRV